MGNSYKRIKSVNTALDILEYVAESPDGASAHRIGQDLNIPFATIMCHLATLGDRAYVRRIGDVYQVGMKLAVYWARVKSRKENEIIRRQDDLALLGDR